MRPGVIRVIAICLIENRGRLFVFKGCDPATGVTYYRPLGGGVEFGETGAHCVARELREEIGAELEAVDYLGTIENVFTYDGQMGHEIVLVYRARFVEPERYQPGPVMVHEECEVLTAHWVALEDFESGAARLVPKGLLELLEPGS